MPSYLGGFPSRVTNALQKIDEAQQVLKVGLLSIAL
jgi:hypothetical protein